MNLPERRFFNINSGLRMLLMLVCVAALGTATLAQKTRNWGGRDGDIKSMPATVESSLAPEATPTPAPTPTSGPIVFERSNTECADLVGNPNFPNVSAATIEFKYGESGSDYNFADAFFFKTYSTSHGPVVTIPANDPRFNTKQIYFSVSQSSQTHTLNSFTSQLGISAVIFKLGPDSIAWDYSTNGGSVFSGGPLSYTHPNGFSHIIFCAENTLGTTAADVSVSGRVLTASGRAVAGAEVVITNAETGRAYRAMTNPFGYYTIEGLDSAAFYIATVGKKGMKFAENTKSFSLNDSLADLDFVANW